MIDWNGNGKIDPADVALSVALDSTIQEKSESKDLEMDTNIGTESQAKVFWNWLKKLIL